MSWLLAGFTNLMLRDWELIDPDSSESAWLLALYAPLLVLAVLLIRRCVNALDRDLDQRLLYEATTPERMFVLSCVLLTAALLLSSVMQFDVTVWGVLISVVAVGPWVSYAHHVGQLRVLLHEEPGSTEVTRLSTELVELSADRDRLKSKIEAMERATVWQRIRRQYR